jgi:hypothetical protein
LWIFITLGDSSILVSGFHLELLMHSCRLSLAWQGCRVIVEKNSGKSLGFS